MSDYFSTDLITNFPVINLWGSVWVTGISIGTIGEAIERKRWRLCIDGADALTEKTACGRLGHDGRAESHPTCHRGSSNAQKQQRETPLLW